MRPFSGLCFFVTAVLASGAEDLIAPSINVRIAEPEGSATALATAGAARGVGRFLLATEDRVRKNDVLLAQAMSSATAQMNELADAVEARLQARAGRL